jgi:hypothetical protein
MIWRSGLNRCAPAGPGGEQVRAGGEHAAQHVALVGFGPGQGEGDGQALQRAPQVQLQAPEVAGVAGAVPVPGPSGQVRALGGLAGATAPDRGGTDHPDVIGPDGSVAGRTRMKCRIIDAAARSRLL